MMKNANERAAIDDFIRQVTVPILLDVGPTPALQGTGTLLNVHGRVFLVTARHVLDNIDPLIFAFPANAQRGSIHTLGIRQILKPRDFRIDVAAIELQDPEVLELVRSNWRTLTLANVASPSQTTADQAVLVAGFPAALTKPKDGWLSGALVSTYTQRIPLVPEEMRDSYVNGDYPHNPDFDLYYDHNIEGTDLDGKLVATPKLEGVSGASIWEFVPQSGLLWTAESGARVVGIQSSYLRGKYLRAVNWKAVALVLDQSDPEISQAVRDAYSLGVTDS